jgi:hypothetical protein
MTFTAESSAKNTLEQLTGWKEEWKFKEHCYLMLMTGTPATSGSEGVTMKKCKEKECTVTGYARFKVEKTAGHELAFSESAAKGILENSAEWEIESGLSGAGQAITYWALVQESSGESGKVISWGSCTSTEISGTQTPVKVASGKLKVELG